ncbi:hypothetical protein X975_14685, partial [Stegodyphus mimosarum]
MDFDIKHVLVKGCGTVTMPLGALTHLRLETIQLLDIKQLNIKPFALAGVQGIESLTIANVSEFNVRSHGFVGLFNISRLIISNVSATYLSTNSFGFVSNVKYFLIEHSNFVHVEDAAFFIANITTFKVYNTKFHELRNTSFEVHISDEVIFENCYFGETNEHSFSLSSIHNITFQSCKFGLLAASSFLSSELQTFILQNCTIETLEKDAFASLDVSEKLIFTHNSIEIVDAYAMTSNIVSNFTKPLKVENCCNGFTCDCSIFWMLSSDYDSRQYDSFSQQSFCIGNPSTKLTDLVPVLDSSENCMTLEMKSRQLPKEFAIYKSKGQILSLQIGMQLLNMIWIFHFVSSTHYAAEVI